jgi:hypothetical protein
VIKDKSGISPAGTLVEINVTLDIKITPLLSVGVASIVNVQYSSSYSNVAIEPGCKVVRNVVVSTLGSKGKALNAKALAFSN